MNCLSELYIHVGLWSQPLMYCNHCIMEYGSTPYVGMAREKNGCHIKPVQNPVLKCLLYTLS